MKTIKDISLAGKTAVVRADYNVPVEDGRITDDYRIRKNIQTLQYLLDQDCRLVIISHLGRPQGSPDPAASLRPVSRRLEELLGRSVAFATDFAEVDEQQPITVCENLRFYPQEEANDRTFARQLASLGEVFVQDGFGVVHRAHASTQAITEFLPSVAGLLLKEEVDTITSTMEHPDHPLVAIMGGAKVSDKLELMKRMVARADRVLVGGAMANTFLAYHGYDIGRSSFEEGQEQAITEIYAEIEKQGGTDTLWLPRDGVYVSDVLEASATSTQVATDHIGEDDYVLDNVIPDGIVHEIKAAGTVIWNGPVGMTEFPDFTYGSFRIAEAIGQSNAKSIVGGGDTAAFVQQHGLSDNFDWVSTGGGAALDLMAAKELPGIAALRD